MTAQEIIAAVVLGIIGLALIVWGFMSGRLIWGTLLVLGGIYIAVNGYAFINLYGLNEDYLLIYKGIHSMFFQKNRYESIFS